MKNIFYIIMLTFISSCSISAQIKESEDIKFIVISNVGMSNYSVSPLVISTDTIKNILYKKGIYDLHAKYKGFNNVVIDKANYKKLLSHFNMHQSCQLRPEKFIRDEQAVLIIDYRVGDESDCKLLTIKDISTVLYTLEKLHCYLQSNNFDKRLLSHIKVLYQFYIDTYDYKKELYRNSIECY